MRQLFSRAAMTLLLTVLTAMTAWANEPVKYIDENGVEQEVTEYTVLTGNETPNSYGWIELAEGTYVVNSDITYQYPIISSGTGSIMLILANGANMISEPEPTHTYNISVDNLSVYGEKDNPGTLTLRPYSESNISVEGNLTVNGGTISAYGEVFFLAGYFILNGGSVTVNQDANGKASIDADKDFTVNGGTLTVNGSDYGINASENFTINGGEVTVSGSQYGIKGKLITITGGTVNATATATTGNISQGIIGRFTMSGGVVTATGYQYGIYSKGTIRFSGGQLTANVATGSEWSDSAGIYSNSISYFSYSHASDFIKASSYSLYRICFAPDNDNAGRYAFVDEANPATEFSGIHTHSGDLEAILASMAGKKLVPKHCTVNLQNGIMASGENVTVDDGTVKATVALPVTLTTPGYENVSLTVKDANNADVTLTDGTFTMPNSDVTVTGTMTPIVYTISYDLCGGTLTAANPATYTVETPSFTLNNPSLTGIDFLGWTGTGLDDPTTTVTIAQGSIGNRTYKANFDIATLQDGTAYTLTGDAVVKAATYIKTIDEQRVGRHQAWLVPFDYTLTQDDLDAFTFYKINMIANSPSPSVEATDEVWVFLKKLNEGDMLHANMPYVYKPKAAVTDYYAFTTPNATLKAKNTGVIAKTETMEDIYSFYATYDQYTTATTADPFYYVGIDGSLSLGTSVSVGPLRWIIRKESKFGNETSYAREMHFFDGEATGIGAVDADLKSASHESGISNPLQHGWYTIDGRKLDGKPTTKGVYVVNGRKVVIK